MEESDGQDFEFLMMLFSMHSKQLSTLENAKMLAYHASRANNPEDSGILVGKNSYLYMKPGDINFESFGGSIKTISAIDAGFNKN